MKKTLWLALAFVSMSAANAQTVEFFTPRTVRIVKDNGQKVEKKSLVVIASPEQVKVSQSKQGNATIYKSSALTVTVENGKVSFADNKGNLLTSEGDCAFTPITKGPDTDAYKVKQTFSVEADEGIYGVGMLQNGKMSQRGENRRMEQSNLEDFAHFYQTIKGYGIFWDNYSPTRLVTPAEGKAGNIELESEVGKMVDYYFIYGGDADGVIAEMRHLSGAVPMFPLWTYGFHQCRERYKSQAELLEVVHKYRDLKVPFDGIIQDWQYWGSNYNWNAMEFLNPDFDRAQDMIDEVHRQNAHISISIWASFGPETKAFKEMKPKGLMLDFDTWPQSGLPQWPPRRDYPSGVRCYDVYSKEARDIYWKNLSRLHKMGIDAWWMDSTDPDQMDLTEEQRDQPTAMGSYRSVRNAFPLMTVGGVYDSQRAVDDSKRVFILTRSYFAGQQRYGANTWSGDIGSSWDSFRKQVPLFLNYTLTANPNTNADIGGFFAGSYSTQGHNSATRNPQYQELFVRWMQFGAFTPMMRSHGADIYRELYYFGKQGEPVYDALLDAIKLRYRFLPYIYSQSWQVTKNNDSFMRALFMDFKADKETWNNNRQYMFGHNVLVCPVVDPLYTQEKIVKTDPMSGWDRQNLQRETYAKVDWTASKTFSVYLPAGVQWYDYWTNAKLNGGQTITASAPLSHSPLYIKAGSILPLGPDVQYANENKFDNIDLVVYPGANATFTLYEDEGDNYNYEKGQYSTIQLTWNDRSKTLTIGKREGSFPGMIATRTFNVKVIGGTQKSVTYSGKALTIK
jgi:alpha-D-xyloside xylohydrolase